MVSMPQVIYLFGLIGPKYLCDIWPHGPFTALRHRALAPHNGALFSRKHRKAFWDFGLASDLPAEAPKRNGRGVLSLRHYETYMIS
jgi:hypothetical protein